MLRSAYLALFSSSPTITVIFALMPIKRVRYQAVIGGWLLLPPLTIRISNFPDYSKVTATSMDWFLARYFRLPERHLVPPRWFDVPMVLWCFINLASSLSNNLGIYDGLAQSLARLSPGVCLTCSVGFISVITPAYALLRFGWSYGGMLVCFRVYGNSG